MDAETEKIFKGQRDKLPNEVISFLSSANWDTDLEEIGTLYNLSEEEMGTFKREVILILVGLVHPDALTGTLKQEVGIEGAVLEGLVANVEKKIFSSIRPALISFFEKEARAENAETAVVEENTEAPTEEEVARAANIFPKEILVATPTPPEPTRVWEKEPDVAPDNLPIAEEIELAAPLIPPISPKAPSLEVLPLNEAPEPVHPFEEKMKKVFTAGPQSMNELALEQVTPGATPATTSEVLPAATETPKSTPPRHADPYREPIE